MFDYDLKGKHVVLVLDKEILPYLKHCGIHGSPLFAKVQSMDPNGLWLETDSFTLCPIKIPKKKDHSSGEYYCRAHVFIPAKGIVSCVAFPDDPSGMEIDESAYTRIGFQVPAEKTR